MSIDAVALLRIADWDPEDVDTRPLDDGTLVFLDTPFDSPPEELFQALEDLVGEELARHDDPRGLFVFPDAAEPEDAETYEDVITAVGDVGLWFGEEVTEPPLDLQQLFGEGVQSILNDTLSAMGQGSMEDMQRLLQSGDKDALLRAQIQMQSALEELGNRSMPGASKQDDGEGEGSSNKGAPPSPKGK